MNKLYTLVFALPLFASTDAQSIFDKAKKALSGKSQVSESEADGIKEALNNGISSAVSHLNKPDAFFKSELYKILLPPEAQKMEKTLRDIGLGEMADDAIEAINRGAEDAVGFATPIFVDAIKQMTITDALKLVSGGKIPSQNISGPRPVPNSKQLLHLLLIHHFKKRMPPNITVMP